MYAWNGRSTLGAQVAAERETVLHWGLRLSPSISLPSSLVKRSSSSGAVRGAARARAVFKPQFERGVHCRQPPPTASARAPLARPKAVRDTPKCGGERRVHHVSPGSAASKLCVRQCERNRRRNLRCACKSKLPVLTAGCAGLNSPGRAREESMANACVNTLLGRVYTQFP